MQVFARVPGVIGHGTLYACACVTWSNTANWKVDRVRNAAEITTERKTTDNILRVLTVYSWQLWLTDDTRPRQKVEGFLRRSTRARFCSRNEPNFSDICLEADQNLFRNVLHTPQHVLHQLLPPVSATSHSYSLRTRTHNRQLPDRLSRLADCNFITHMLFYQSYWHSSAFILSFIVNDVNNCVFVCSNAVYILLRCNCGLSVITVINEYVMLCYVINAQAN